MKTTKLLEEPFQKSPPKFNFDLSKMPFQAKDLYVKSHHTDFKIINTNTKFNTTTMGENRLTINFGDEINLIQIKKELIIYFCKTTYEKYQMEQKLENTLRGNIHINNKNIYMKLRTNNKKTRYKESVSIRQLTKNMLFDNSLKISTIIKDISIKTKNMDIESYNNYYQTLPLCFLKLYPKNNYKFKTPIKKFYVGEINFKLFDDGTLQAVRCDDENYIFGEIVVEIKVNIDYQKFGNVLLNKIKNKEL